MTRRASTPTSVSLGLSIPLLLSLGCGGTQDQARPERDDTEVKTELDLRDCEAIAEVYEFELLDGFNGGDITDGKNPAPALGWYVSEDHTNGTDGDRTKDPHFSPSKRSGLLPEAGGAPALGESAAFALCDASPKAMHLKSWEPGFTNWGYSLGANIKAAADGIDYRDASNWDGLAVWVKRAKSSPNATITAKVTDQYTESSNHDYCLDGLYVPESCDAFSRGVGPDLTWRLVLIPFEHMVQQGFGRPSEMSLPEVEALIGLEFNVSKGTWDMWLDEVSWYRSRKGK
jgi:hypothetical protein